MNTHTPSPPSHRIYSPSHQLWVDITDHGEIAMSASKLEFTTSFSIGGVHSFILTNGKCWFKDDNVFVLWNPNTILISYIRENETLHLTSEDFDEANTFFELKDIESQNPKLLIYQSQKIVETRDLFSSLQLFKQGRGLR